MDFEDDCGTNTEAHFMLADMFPASGQIPRRSYGKISTHLPCRALLESPEQGYVNVQPFSWYQPDKNITGPVFKRTPAFEVSWRRTKAITLVSAPSST